MQKRKVVYSIDTLYKIVRDVKGQGKRICLTHGAFDLFHYSHLDLLQKSAAICDFLIVGVDSDESISKYKSYKRPIVNQDWRLRIINELNCVDAVFIKDIEISKSAHLDLYKNLLVDLVSIGTKFDKKFKNVIYEETEELGLKLIEMETIQEPSTTSIINTIMKRYSEREVPKEE